MNHAQVDAEAMFSASLALQRDGGRASPAARALGLLRDGDGAEMHLDDVTRRMEEAIAGDRDTRRRCRELLDEVHPGGYACDEVALALLRHARVPVEVAAAIGVLTRELDIDPIHFEVMTPEGKTVGVQVEGQDAGMSVEADLAPERTVTWLQPVVALGGAVPDAILDSVAGRPLSEILSHPALDGMGLTVESAWRGKKGGAALALAPVASIDVMEGLREPAAASSAHA